MPASRFRLFATASIILAACAGGSSTEPPLATVTYVGVFATLTESGRVTLVTGSPASGSLNVSGGPTVVLSGTFTPATATGGSTVALSGTFTPAMATFAMTGSGYTVNASVNAAAEVTGTVTTAAAPTGGTLAALVSTTAAPAMYYYGTFLQTNNAAGVVAEAGKMCLTINGKVVTGLALQTRGEGNSTNVIPLIGRLETITLTFGWGAGYGSAQGNLKDNGGWTGTFSNADNVRGVWDTFLNPECILLFGD